MNRVSKIAVLLLLNSPITIPPPWPSPCTGWATIACLGVGVHVHRRTRSRPSPRSVDIDQDERRHRAGRFLRLHRQNPPFGQRNLLRHRHRTRRRYTPHYYPPFQPCFQPTPVPSALAPRSTPRQAAVPGPVVALYCTPRAPATAHVRILLCSLAPGAWLDDGAHNAAHALLRTHTRHAHACTRR